MRVINGRYQLYKTLREMEMGLIHLATNRLTQQQAAPKQIQVNQIHLVPYLQGDYKTALRTVSSISQARLFNTF